MAILWGDPFRVMQGSTLPSVVTLADGRFAVLSASIVHENANKRSFITTIHVQIFNADGSAAGDSILVDDTREPGSIYPGSRFYYRPSIYSTSDGGFVVAWADIDAKICVQAYDRNGAASGPLIQPAGTSFRTSVLEKSDGTLLVTWMESGVLKQQGFNPDGSPTGAVTSFGISGGIVETKALDDGRLAIIFARNTDIPGNGNLVDVETFFIVSDANGQFDPANVMPLSTYGYVATSLGAQGDVTQLQNGNLVVTWSTGEFIGGRLFDSNGAPLSPELRFDLPSNLYLGDVAITPLQDGGFVGVWANRVGDSGTHDPLYQLFFADGTRNGPPVVFAPGMGRNGERFTFTLSDVDALPDGRFVVVWTGSGIRAQIIDPRTGAVQLVASDTGTQLIGTSFADTLTGGLGNDRLEGDYGADLISGGAGADFLDGGGSDDILDGGTGNDWMRGGGGDDIFVVDSLGDVVSENADGGIDVIRTGLDGYVLTAANVEGLELTGSADLTAYGDNLANYLYGNAGNNALHGYGGADLLDGGAGDDVLDGGIGADWMRGGAGDDVYYVDDQFDVVTEGVGGGIDIIRTGMNGFVLTAANVEGVELTGVSDLTVYGDGRANYLYGNSGSNSLFGDAGDDLLDGGAGNDGYLGGSGDDILRDLGGGRDTFVFQWNFGRDVIIGFEAGSGLGDVMVFQRSAFANLDALVAAWSDDGHGNTVIDAGNGNTVTIYGVTTAQFAANDFVFE